MIRFLVFIAFMLIYGLILTFFYKKNLKKLGIIEYDEVTIIVDAGFNRAVLFFVAFLAIVLFYIFFEYRDLDWIEVIILAIASFLTCEMAIPVVAIKAPHGFYENGIMTSSGVVFYNKIKSYKIENNKDDISLVSFNANMKVTTLVPYINIDTRDVKKLKRFLKSKGIENIK